MKTNSFPHIRFWLTTLFFVLFYLMPYQTVHAQTVKYSTEDIEVQKVPEDKIEKYRNDNDFKYIEKPPPENNLWNIFWYYVRKILQAIFSDEGVAPYIRNTLLIAVIVLIIIKLLMSDITGFFARNKKIKSGDFQYAEEDIHGIDFDKETRKAIDEGDYRLAVRFLFLKLLHILDEKKLINWEPGATNKKYRQELKKHPVINHFNYLSKIYEYSWYGHFEPERDIFEQFHTQFQESYSIINKKS